MKRCQYWLEMDIDEFIWSNIHQWIEQSVMKWKAEVLFQCWSQWFLFCFSSFFFLSRTFAEWKARLRNLLKTSMSCRMQTGWGNGYFPLLCACFPVSSIKCDITPSQARFWVQVMRDLRDGVKLKKVQERQYNPLPIEYQLTPYEMLMDDIRSKRYKLRKVMVRFLLTCAAQSISPPSAHQHRFRDRASRSRWTGTSRRG